MFIFSFLLPAHSVYYQDDTSICQWINVFSFLLLMCDADREREAVLEAGVDGSDREGLVTVQQFTTWQGGLAEPCTHLPTFSHTVGCLYRDLTYGLVAFAPFAHTILFLY